MFSGIVEAIGRVGAVRETARERVISIRRPRGWKLVEGESVAVEGVCSTVQHRSATSFEVVYMHETLRRTTLGKLGVDSPVNLERSMRLNALVCGHLVQGHIAATARIRSIRKEGSALIFEFAIPTRYECYIVEKGSVTLDGISLTVKTETPQGFTVSLLAYTLKHTTLGGKRVGDFVNFEADLIAKHLEKLLRK